MYLLVGTCSYRKHTTKLLRLYFCLHFYLLFYLFIYFKEYHYSNSSLHYISQTWDENLASMGLEYSEKCIWGHGEVPNTSPYENIGQNLWIKGGTTQQPDPGAGVIAWHNEVNDYNYDKNSCKAGKQCGHYTQVSLFLCLFLFSILN